MTASETYLQQMTRAVESVKPQGQSAKRIRERQKPECLLGGCLLYCFPRRLRVSWTTANDWWGVNGVATLAILPARSTLQPVKEPTA